MSAKSGMHAKTGCHLFIALQIVVLDQGRIIESGTHSQLLAENGRYKMMWQRQATVDDVGVDVNTV